MGKKTRDSLVMQAAVLAAAGIISRIIGLLYRSPLTSAIGAAGNGYYSSAYYIYTIVLLISSYSIPSAVSKIIASRLAVKEYRNAHRVFRCALLYVLIVGTIGAAVLFFGASALARQEGCIPAIKIFAPTVLIYGPLGVLRGYFQAHKSMVQTSISQIMEQIVNAVASVGFAYLFIGMVKADATISMADLPDREAVWGAAGSAVGTGMGVVMGLLVMLGMYLLNRRIIMNRVQKDKHHNVSPYTEIFKEITLLVTPFILSTAIYNLSSVVNSQIYQGSYKWVEGAVKDTVNETFGLFSAQAMTISTIPIAFASAMAAAMIPSITESITSKLFDDAKAKIALAVKTTMIISIPSAVGIGVLAKPIILLLFPRTTPEELDIAGKVLVVLSLSVVFFALSTLNNSILQGIGRVNTPVVNAAIALVIQTVILVGLLKFTNLGIYSVAIVNLVYSGVLSFLNQFFVGRELGYKQEFKRTFGSPLLASAIMGLAAWGTYQALYAVTLSMRISVIPAIIVAVVFYFAALLIFNGLTEEELRSIPKGHLIVKVAKKCKLL
ncbi:MAG: polysaccharide biosynthesis protein [Agathobacter sp.]|nr:polysaccharide biosynthesis protein [Agathobacter sp.]